MRYSDIIPLDESQSLKSSMPRQQAADAITTWFAQHGIEEKPNLASPFGIVLLGHETSIRVDLRDWPDGKVDAWSRYLELRSEFDSFVKRLGWHVTMHRQAQGGQFGTLVYVKLQPNYPDEVSVPRFLEHYTPAANLVSIEQHGLQPRTGRSSDIYPARIYLMIPGANGAWEAAQHLRIDAPGAWAKLKIDTSRIPEAKFYRDPELGKAGVWTYEAIPPAAIQVVTRDIK